MKLPWLEHAWEARPLADRVVVFDTETTGLNPGRDELLSIGAVAVSSGGIDLQDSFYGLIRPQTRPRADNVLVHRLTPGHLASAGDLSGVLTSFNEYVADAPLLAYHADFDRRMLRHACKHTVLQPPEGPYIDVAEWVLLDHPDAGSRPMSLDAATAYFRLQVQDRHNAHADALVTAQIALKLLRTSQRSGLQTLGDLVHALKRNRISRAWRH